ncbi:MAG: hypothetical protein JST16_13310 [Bdellovibrionales bacterium]|nr:hypothetical protein [Bdellovibrionales bacterium]
MATPLTSGDVFEVSCASGAAPALKVGDKFPADKAQFIVVRVEGAKVTLGPLLTGDLNSSFNCADGSTQAVTVSVIGFKKEDLPNREASLAPEKLAYPLWLWLVPVAVFLASWLSFKIYDWTYGAKKRKKAAAKRPTPPAKSPDERFDEFLNRAEKERWTEKDASEDVKRLYVEGYERLRAYIEFKFVFRVPEATTKEFLGEFKAHQPAGDLPGTVEALMLQADQVRFAGEVPPREVRAAFVKNLRQVRGAA